MSPEDRRKHRRITLSVPAEIYVGQNKTATSGQLQNFSRSGAWFTSPIELSVGTEVYVGFYLGEHHDRPRCEATGTIVRTLPFGKDTGVGLEFKFADDNFIGFLQQLNTSREADRPELLGQIRELELHVS